MGTGRFEAKLDSSGHRYEAFFERRRERPLVEVGEPEGDCCSRQTHDRARPRKPIGARLTRERIGKDCEQPGSQPLEPSRIPHFAVAAVRSAKLMTRMS